MNDNNIDIKLKELFSDTKIEPSNNLIYRIMRQIETEDSLKKVKEKPSFSVLTILSGFAAIYGVVAIFLLIIYFAYGKENLSDFGIMLLSIISVCNLFWAISVFDDKRWSRKQK